MNEKERLIEILSAPIHTRIGADPIEAAAEYLTDNDVVPIVRCKDCKHHRQHQYCKKHLILYSASFFCADGERKDAE